MPQIGRSSPIPTAQTPSPSHRRFVCQKLLLNGRRCNAAFTRAYTLKRHDLDIHEYRSTTFVDCNPGANRRRTIQRSSPLMTPEPATALMIPVFTATRAAATVSSQSDTPMMSTPISTLDLPLGPAVFPHGWSTAPASTFSQSQSVQIPPTSLEAIPSRTRMDLPLGTTPRSYLGDTNRSHSPARNRSPNQIIENASNDGYHREVGSCREAAHGPPIEVAHSNVTGRKRRWSTVSNGRCFEALRKDHMPIYEVKMSKRIRDQHRGLDWRTKIAQTTFNKSYESLLARWGVKSGHKGTCVLVPEDWKPLDPLDVMALFSRENMPSESSSRAWYSYSDHGTSLARALVWFSRWPRTGLEHDNFMGSGPFKPMEASHLCHHGLCILHLHYEGAEVNQDREECRKEARRLRQDGAMVPTGCVKHNPPCLMQVCLSCRIRTNLLIDYLLACCFDHVRDMLHPICHLTKSQGLTTIGSSVDATEISVSDSRVPASYIVLRHNN